MPRARPRRREAARTAASTEDERDRRKNSAFSNFDFDLRCLRRTSTDRDAPPPWISVPFRSVPFRSVPGLVPFAPLSHPYRRRALTAPRPPEPLPLSRRSLLASGSKDVSDDVAAAFATKHDLKPHEIKVAVSHLYDAHAEKIAAAAAAAASASPVSAAAPIVLDASPAKPAAAKKNPAATAHGGLPGKPLAAASSPSAKPATATVTFATKTGISAEVRVDLVCGPARGTLVLPKWYKQKQEYVVYPDGRKISPAAFERDGGKEKSKSWKNSCIVVTNDAFNGKTFKRWVDATGYHPVGTEIEGAAAPADEKKKKSKKSSKEKSKKAEEEDEEEVEKSVFERNIEPLLDDAGGIKAIDMTGRFVWLMRNALKNAERSLVISVIHRTSKPIMRSFVDGSDGVKVLYEWCAAARDTNKSSLVLKILKTLRKLPVTFAVLEKTPEFAKFVNKLRKYAPPGKESEDLTIQVQDNAMELKAKWVKMITAENAAKEAAAAKKAAAAKAAAAPPVVGVKRDAAAAAAAATAAAAKRPRVDAVPTPPQPAVAKPTLNPKPAAPAPTKIAAPAPSSTKIGSAATTTKVTTTKVTTTISRPASSALSFGGINIRGAGFPSKPSGGDASKATSAKPAKPASPPPPKFKYSKPTSARAKKGLSWAADTALEAVQFFFKDDAAAKPPSPPSISRADADGGKDKDDDENETEDDAEAMKKARQRQERELAAEARAANLTRQRRLNEMRAIGSWRRPATYVYPKDVEIESGSESTEAKRMAQRVSRVPETTYAMTSLIPASPGEAPGEAPHDDAKTPAVPVVAAKQQPQQQQQQQQQQQGSMHQNQYASAQQQQQQHQQQGGGSGGFDANALQALLASVQSGALKGAGGGGGREPPVVAFPGRDRERGFGGRGHRGDRPRSRSRDRGRDRSRDRHGGRDRASSRDRGGYYRR